MKWVEKNGSSFGILVLFYVQTPDRSRLRWGFLAVKLTEGGEGGEGEGGVIGEHVSAIPWCSIKVDEISVSHYTYKSECGMFSCKWCMWLDYGITYIDFIKSSQVVRKLLRVLWSYPSLNPYQIWCALAKFNDLRTVVWGLVCDGLGSSISQIFTPYL